MVPMRTPRPGEGARSVRGCRVHRLIHTALLEVQALRAHPHLPAPLMWVPLLERDASAGARAWSTFCPHPIGTQRFATVSSGTSFAQVAGAILRKQARVQNPDKDEGGSSSPPRPTIRLLSSENAGSCILGSRSPCMHGTRWLVVGVAQNQPGHRAGRAWAPGQVAEPPRVQWRLSSVARVMVGV